MPRRQTITIIYTNDIHSQFERMPKIASAIRRLRDSGEAGTTVAVEIGDHMDRMHPETEGTEGRANVAVMNLTGYDIALPGNNEGLTYSLEEIRRAYADARFAVIGSNMYERSSGRLPDWLAETVILERGGLRIGFIGVTAAFTEFYSLLGWDVRDPLPLVDRNVRRLRPDVQVLVVMSHLGLSLDKRMAAEIPGIDVILGGHTHHLLEEPLMIGRTAVCGAGHLGRHVGEVAVTYDADESAVVAIEGRCHATDEYPDDPDLVRLIEAYREESERTLRQSVARLSRPLASSSREESELGNMLAAGIREWTQAEIGIVNAGQILDSLDAGVVTKRRLLEICPSPINPCTFWLTGASLLQALEESLLDDFRERPIRGFGFRGRVLGALCVDGMQVEYEQEGEPYRRITQVYINGEPLHQDREYLVGSLDMFTFGVGYVSLSQGRERKYYLPEFIRDVLGRELQKPDAIAKAGLPRWSLNV